MNSTKDVPIGVVVVDSARSIVSFIMHRLCRGQLAIMQGTKPGNRVVLPVENLLPRSYEILSVDIRARYRKLLLIVSVASR